MKKVIAFVVVFFIFAGLANAALLDAFAYSNYSDDNCQGLQLEDVNVTLYRSGGGVFDRTKTNCCGDANFSGVTAGTYTIEYKKPGYVTLTKSLTISSVSYQYAHGTLSSSTKVPHLTHLNGVITDFLNASKAVLNVTVTLYNSSGSLIGVTYSNSSCHCSDSSAKMMGCNFGNPGSYVFSNVSDPTGRYLKNGTYTVNFSKQGYMPESKTIYLDDCQNTLDIRLKPYVNCGLRIYNGSAIVNISCEPTASIASPLRIYNGSGIFGVALVGVADPMATNMRIQTASGIKALRKL